MRTLALTLTLTAAAALLAACSSTYKAAETGELQEVRQEARQAVQDYRQTDPTLQEFFGSSAGYAVFPSVTKGAAGVGAARGRGIVYGPGGGLHGYSTLTQASVGLQLGGQTYSEIIFFQTAQDLEDFKSGDYEFSAQASAVALQRGAAKNADFKDGVAVFTQGEQGLMFEASIGGQKFSYTPKGEISPGR
jgi:lipid-binding SYLF domain-containing protein